MKSSFGKKLKITVFGSSHEDEIGVEIRGLNPEINIDMNALQEFMKRRAPGNSPYTTLRKEKDIPIKTSNNPLTFVIKNTDRRSSDYKNTISVPRPGHADFTAYMKYGKKINMSGGGPFSARMTAPLCIAGGIALQLLAKKDIFIKAELAAVGNKTGPEMYDEILSAKNACDSVGGLVTAKITGCPAGLGGPMYDGLESVLAPILFGIPGVKGVSFGVGFHAATLRGSENNDPFIIEENLVKTKTNNCGGILGGISNGMPIIVNVALKPTPSISMPQESINLETMTSEILEIKGRHDPCIAVRAVPVVEAALAVGILDEMMEEEKWI